MLDVRLTISDNAKASKLLDLLKELPFVEITSCQEVSPHDKELLAAIFRHWNAQPNQSSGVIQEVSSQVSVSISLLISDKVMRSYGREKLLPVFAQLAANAISTDAIELLVDDDQMYCRYLDGFRVLYTCGVSSWTRQPSVNVFDILKL